MLSSAVSSPGTVSEILRETLALTSETRSSESALMLLKVT